MDCPVCKNAMITLELSEVEVDYCTACGGIWLDKGELGLLLGNPEKAQELLRSLQTQSHPTEALHKCPICRKKMQKIIAGTSQPPLVIDECRRNHGLWFDKGELRDILDKAQLDKEHKIQKLLADMFGIASKESEE